jgi:hypothetical protein
MATPDPQPDYLVRLRPLPGGYSPLTRLRRFLKAALRVYRLKAVTAIEVDPVAGQARSTRPTR